MATEEKIIDELWGAHIAARGTFGCRENFRPFAKRLADAERDADMYRAWHIRWAHELHDIAGVSRFEYEPIPANAVDASIALVMGVTSKLRAERDSLQREVERLTNRLDADYHNDLGLVGVKVPASLTNHERLERLERAVRQLAAYSKERLAPNDWAGAVGEISRELAKRESDQ